MWTTIRRRLRRARLPVLARATMVTLLAGIVGSALLYASLRGVEQERERNEFADSAEVRFAAVTRSFEDAIRALRALNLLFNSVGEVSRDEFGAFATPLSQVHPEARALVFHRFVRGDERAAFEAARRRIWPGFQITDQVPGGLVRAGQRELYLVDDYVVPLAGNEVTLGYDTWFPPEHRALTQRAIDTGLPTASGFVPLLQIKNTPGVLIVMPVYRKGALLPDVAARRRAVLGDTEVVLDIAALVRHNLASAGLLEQPRVSLSLAEMAEGRPGQSYRFGAAAAQPARWERWLGTQSFSSLREIEVAGRRWQVGVAGAGAALPGHLGSAGVLALGLLLSVAISGYVQTRAERTRRIERLVQHRTGALKRASDALHLYLRAIESSANGIILIDAVAAGCPIVYVNPAYERMRGKPAEALVGLRVTEMAASEPDQPGLEELRSAMRERRAGHALLRHRGLDGREAFSDVYIAPVNNPAGVTEHFVVSVYDVTTAKRYEAELERRARYDTLTGLANRALLADRLEQAVAFAAADGGLLWVAALDLDQFRFVNDSLGHEAGDELLRLVAPRITQALPRSTDTVARTGGDEFVLVLSSCADERGAAAAVRRVLDALAEPLVLREQTLFVTGSAGLAAYPGDGEDGPTLVKHAELAMYRAKEAGRNAIQFFRPALTARALERLELEGALRHALGHGELELHYQPQVDLASGAVVGMEALLRWHHPRLGLVGPERFIGLAEETGLIVQIGAWVLRSACIQNQAWQRAGFGPLRIAVNMSARQFAEPGLACEVASVLAESELSPDQLEIEVTETLVMSDAEAAIATMHELKAMGVRMSIDDFGTGYSSLSYLKRFPVDVLKIDRSFVHDLATSGEDAAMVDAIISLARGLQMRVIAEGVETPAQLAYLREQGCDEAQGYLYSRALPVTEVEHILRNGTCLAAA